MARVLVADDEPDQLVELRRALQSAGHEVVLASDGRLALARLEEQGPEVVVLDLLMPVLDGWAVLEELRQRAAGVPVVVLLPTESGGSVLERRALDAGAVACLAKPVRADELVALVDGVLSRR